MALVFPATLEAHIRDGRWTAQQLCAMGIVIVGFVLTLPLDKKVEDVCTRCLAALRSGDEAELRAAYVATYATYANAATAATANATAAAANATNAATYATTYATAAARAALRCSTSGKARIRKNFNFMVAQLALIVG